MVAAVFCHRLLCSKSRALRYSRAELLTPRPGTLARRGNASAQSGNTHCADSERENGRRPRPSRLRIRRSDRCYVAHEGGVLALLSVGVVIAGVVAGRVFGRSCPSARVVPPSSHAPPYGRLRSRSQLEAMHGQAGRYRPLPVAQLTLPVPPLAMREPVGGLDLSYYDDPARPARSTRICRLRHMRAWVCRFRLRLRTHRPATDPAGRRRPLAISASICTVGWSPGVSATSHRRRPAFRFDRRTSTVAGLNPDGAHRILVPPRGDR